MRRITIDPLQSKVIIAICHFLCAREYLDVIMVLGIMCMLIFQVETAQTELDAFIKPALS